MYFHLCAMPKFGDCFGIKKYLPDTAILFLKLMGRPVPTIEIAYERQTGSVGGPLPVPPSFFLTVIVESEVSISMCEIFQRLVSLFDLLEFVFVPVYAPLYLLCIGLKPDIIFHEYGLFFLCHDSALVDLKSWVSTMTI